MSLIKKGCISKKRISGDRVKKKIKRKIKGHKCGGGEERER